jgi:hypothetical protein
VQGNSSVFGGGLYVYGTVALTNDTFSSNTASAGGGLYVYGAVTLTNDTVSANTARGRDGVGGVQGRNGTRWSPDGGNGGNGGNGGDGLGGGVYVDSGTVTLTNVTLSGNTVQGGNGGRGGYGGYGYFQGFHYWGKGGNGGHGGNGGNAFGAGLFVNSYATVTLAGVTVSSNTAGPAGRRGDGGPGGYGTIDGQPGSAGASNGLSEGGGVYVASGASVGVDAFTPSHVLNNSPDDIIGPYVLGPTFAVRGFPSPTTAGTAGSFTVTAVDAYGNVLTSYRGTVHFTTFDRQASLPGDYTFTAADQGVHTFSAVLKTSNSIVTAVTDCLIAVDTHTPTLIGLQTGIVVNPAATSQLVVTVPPTNVTAGTAFNVTVTAYDAFGNTATGYAGTVHFTSNDRQASLPPDYTFVPLDRGVHTFSGVILRTAGSKAIQASDTVTSTLTASANLQVDPAAVGSLRVTPPTRVTAGIAFSVTVTALDPFGNTVLTYLGTVSFTSSDAVASLPASYTFVAADKGVHTMKGVILRTAGNDAIQAADTVNSALTGSAVVKVSPAAVSSLRLTAPSQVQAGAAFSITVTAVDQFGNTVPSYQATVSFTSSDGAATLPANYPFVAADKGSHVFQNGAVLRTSGRQTITVTDAALGSISGSVVVDVI